MLFLSSERLNLIWATLDCDCNNSPDYVHVPKSGTNGFWHSILKTMLLSEAWPEEFQLGRTVQVLICIEQLNKMEVCLYTDR